MRLAAALVPAALLGAAIAAPARADHPQPAPDIARLPYVSEGAYKYGQPIPAPTAPPANPNPSGTWFAYDTNVFESLSFPSRQAGDETANDPPGSGDPRYGFCPPDPRFMPYGKCANHQREYLDYFERTMREILGPFGVTVKRYGFDSPGINTEARPSAAAAPSTAPGQAYNIVAAVPGADHPDQSVIVSGHYDVTDSAPAPAWDSSEGHAEVIRAAKIMADYWRATGTRPSATVKFAAWDQEESGTLGSQDFIARNIPPGQEANIRGYFNMDPCAGAYPAYRNGNGVDRIPEVLQLADPASYADKPEVKARIERFNARSEASINEVFDRLDDTIATPQGRQPIFVSDGEAKADPGLTSQRGEVVTAVGGLALFSSDYANFAAIGVPIFNLFPDVFGPHADGTPASAEGVGILHTPRDNLTSINALTSTDQSGLTASEGWAKGMEMCAQIESWNMLGPTMGGAQTATPDVVAYYEALPNAAQPNEKVVFDASGSYQYAQLATRTLTEDSQLSYTWDFGDGTKGTGRTATHAYGAIGRYDTRLTVRNAATGQTDTMTLPVEVRARLAPPALAPPPAEDPDGSFPLSWTYDGPAEGRQGYAVEESTDFQSLVADDAEGDIGRLWNRTPDDGTLKQWQRSDQAQTTLGNKRHSGASSYWTGAFPTVAPAGTNKESVLTLKQAFRVPNQGEPVLSYWSLFASELDDFGQVEVALAGDPSAPLRWQRVDRVTGVFAPDEPGAATAGLEFRTASLAAYRGKDVVVRFRYVLGPSEGNRTQPAGWYVDDIAIGAGTWSEIGRTTATTFGVFGKDAGRYAYRVKAVYRDGITTAGSNVGQVRVTRGAGAAAPSGGGPCRSTRAFRSARAFPRGAGLRLAVVRALRRPFDVAVYRVSGIRGAIGVERVARFLGRTRSFTWRGRGRAVRDGYYFVRFSMRRGGGRAPATERDALVRRGGRFARRPPFQRRDRCATLASVKLYLPVFGGRTRRPLSLSLRLSRRAPVALALLRGRRAVVRYRAMTRRAGPTYRVAFSAKGLPRGDYRVRVTVGRGKRATRVVLVARRI